MTKTIVIFSEIFACLSVLCMVSMSMYICVILSSNTTNFFVRIATADANPRGETNRFPSQNTRFRFSASFWLWWYNVNICLNFILFQLHMAAKIQNISGKNL